MGLAASFLVLVLGAGGVSLGDDPDFVRAQELYVDLECEQALQKLTELESKTPWQRAERAQIALWQALCFAQLSQTEQEREALARAVSFDPNIEAPSFTPPKVKDALLAARNQKQAQAQQADTHSSKVVPKEANTAKTSELPSMDALATAEASGPMDSKDEMSLAQFGTGAVVLGGVALLGGVVSAGFALPNAIAARDPKAFQQDASEKAALANQQLVTGSVFLGTGILLLGSGLALVGADTE